jgi:hypothetical protein
VNHTSNASSTVTNSVIADAFSPADLLTAYVSLLVGVLIFLSIEIRIEIPKEEGVGIKSITRKLLYIITRYRTNRTYSHSISCRNLDRSDHLVISSTSKSVFKYFDIYCGFNYGKYESYYSYCC